MVERQGRGSKQCVARWLCGRASGPGFKTVCSAVVVWSSVRAGVRNHLQRFEVWAVSFTPLFMCLSEETIKAVGPFCPTQGNGTKSVMDSLTLEKDTLKNQEDHI